MKRVLAQGYQARHAATPRARRRWLSPADRIQQSERAAGLRTSGTWKPESGRLWAPDRQFFRELGMHLAAFCAIALAVWAIFAAFYFG